METKDDPDPLERRIQEMAERAKTLSTAAQAAGTQAAAALNGMPHYAELAICEIISQAVFVSRLRTRTRMRLRPGMPERLRQGIRRAAFVQRQAQ